MEKPTIVTQTSDDVTNSSNQEPAIMPSTSSDTVDNTGIQVRF